MAQHKNAKPKPKGWLMSVVDQIYKDGGSRAERGPGRGWEASVLQGGRES